jgi:toxin ParE1/3/4
MHLDFFEEAAAEIEEGRAWYRRRSESAEAAFLREVDHAIAQVTETPHQWAKDAGGTRRYVFPVFPYSLVYFAEGEVVHVVAVAHEKRKPGYWLPRLGR